MNMNEIVVNKVLGATGVITFHKTNPFHQSVFIKISLIVVINVLNRSIPFICSNRLFSVLNELDAASISPKLKKSCPL